MNLTQWREGAKGAKGGETGNDGAMTVHFSLMLSARPRLTCTLAAPPLPILYPVIPARSTPRHSRALCPVIPARSTPVIPAKAGIHSACPRESGGCGRRWDARERRGLRAVLIPQFSLFSLKTAKARFSLGWRIPARPVRECGNMGDAIRETGRRTEISAERALWHMKPS